MNFFTETNFQKLQIYECKITANSVIFYIFVKTNDTAIFFEAIKV